jgi:4-hydroxy-L-threonine phosphate dehydrogenase PdxA
MCLYRNILQVLVAKSDSLYAVLMLEAGELAVIPIADYHCPLRTVADAIGAGADLEVYIHIYTHILLMT